MGYTSRAMPGTGRLVGIGVPRRLACVIGPVLARGAWLAAGAGSTLASCKQPPPAPVAVTIRAKNELGEPVADAKLLGVSPPNQPEPKTDRDGVAYLYITAAEGATFLVRVECPPGYRSPPQPVAVQRFSVAATKSVPEYLVVCHELRHTMVVAVRAEDGPNLPILYLDKEVARTDRSGAAHVTFAMDVHDRITLTIGTPGKENEKLRPQNPFNVFEMGDQDDYQVFTQKFVRPKPPPPAVHAGRTIRVF